MRTVMLFGFMMLTEAIHPEWIGQHAMSVIMMAVVCIAADIAELLNKRRKKC